ncbi:bifunctional 2-polyprenyl-6-hydroxyphenol methylase/3-demethylubiquinol 3-O-methyltransferase UbiG [Pseudomonas sp. URMO17WK12:I12]|uniref:class I SAM-dependent methyltransferase n=1 Tax=Pseudomonas sp. URMO17WK12:I12 TaxID=1259797 RepID=UPI0015A68D9F|nr:class I SAM-dependent methyltransferase [Pseudomonas sp. URMO17WK12:I12]
MNNNTCPVCNGVLSRGIQAWHFKCGSCRYEKADLQPTINQSSAHALIDEADRETGLREVRVSNFRKLLDVISVFKPGGGKLVDVGCAHGWFVEIAMLKFDTIGIEPDEAVFTSTKAKNLPVRKGYFPDALGDSETFDVIVFNDVIEHIPSINDVIAACHQKLNSDGLLVLNLPSSDGVFYKLSRLFSAIGKFGFFERLWQKDLPSPHVHYFNRRNLSSFLQKRNFTPVASGTLPTLGLAGLYTRISYTGNLGTISKILIYCTIAAALPVLRLLPSDIVYVVAKKV